MQRVRRQVEVPPVQEADGTGIVVAVLDTGIGNHPDFSGKLLCFQDFVGNRKERYDDNGHGTHVCGILCGSGKASGGEILGMAPASRLVVGKVLNQKGDGTVEEMLRGLEWVLQIKEQYNIRILNISVGIGTLEEADKEQALRESIERVWNSGILVVCAAGNKGPKPGTISAVGGSGKVVTVGCYDGSFGRTFSGSCETYSGRGEAGGLFRKPDLVAPGTSIVSCNLHWYALHGKIRNGYIAKSGTSMATPIVSGAAALAMQKHPGLSNEACKLKLQYSSTNLNLPWNQQGWGMLNVRRLLEN